MASDNIHDTPLGSHRMVGRVVESAEDFALRKRLGEGVTGRTSPVLTDSVEVRNLTCGNRRAGEVVEICFSLLSEVEREQGLYFAAGIPMNRGCFGILLRDTPATQIDTAQVSGVTSALVNVSNTSHRRAAVQAGSTVLVSTFDNTAPIKILHPPVVTGEQSLAVLIESPCASSTTVLNTSTTTPAPACSGQCKWLWDGSAWQLDEDGCNSTTSAAPTTTTTPNPCVCPVMVTTFGPTTTTPAPACNCTYPRFCGTAEDDCTYTFCASGAHEPSVDCTTTTTTTSTTTTSTTTTEPTTTTGDPCTSTTTAAPECSAGCDWIWIPCALSQNLGR